MTTNASQQEISTNVVVYGEPSLKTITPTAGINAGKEVQVLNFRGYHPNFERNAKNEFERAPSTWYDVQFFGSKAKKVFQHLKEGMVLEVRGKASERVYDKDGEQITSHVITAKGIGLSLLQDGLRSIDYEKPAKQQEHNQQEQEAKAPSKAKSAAKRAPAKTNKGVER